MHAGGLDLPGDATADRHACNGCVNVWRILSQIYCRGDRTKINTENVACGCGHLLWWLVNRGILYCQSGKNTYDLLT